MEQPTTPRRRRRAVGPLGAPEATDEPKADQPERDDTRRDAGDLERYLAERPPHHEPR